jgi:hypothetical protein
MSVARTVPEVIRQHVTLEVESIDRLYLNVYQPSSRASVVLPRSCAFTGDTPSPPRPSWTRRVKGFVAAIERFVQQDQIPLITFARGQRKEDIALGVPGQVRRHRGHPLYRQGPGEDTGLPYRETHQPLNRAEIPLAHPLYGPGQSLLLLCRERLPITI